MTKEDRIAILKGRLAKMESNPKDIKCPGVKRKVARQIRNLTASARG